MGQGLGVERTRSPNTLKPKVRDWHHPPLLLRFSAKRTRVGCRVLGVRVWGIGGSRFGDFGGLGFKV